MRCCSAVPARRRRPPGTPTSSPSRDVDVAVGAVHGRRDRRDDDDRGERRAGRLALAEAEPEDEQRHDHDAAADAEQPAEEPGQSCRSPPAAMRSARRHARHTRSHVSRRHARRGARAAARRPGPRGRPARHRRDARADRPPRRRRRTCPSRRARSSSRSPSATALVGCISGRQAPVARRIVSLGLDRLRRQPRRPSCCAAGGDARSRSTPRSPSTSRRVRRFADATSGRRSCSACACAPRTSSAIAAFHWRGAPDEAAAEEAVRAIADARGGRGPVHPLGAQGARGPPAGRDRQGPRRAPAARRRATSPRGLYVGDDRTDIDAFDGLRALVDEGELGAAVCVGVRSDETPPELEQARRRARRRPDRRARAARRPSL